MRRRTHITDHIKILCQEEQVHDFLGAGSTNSSLEIHNACAQSINNCLALFGNTNTTQVLGFGLGFCSLDLQNFVSLFMYTMSKKGQTA
jgi:hypothetical protein